MGAAKKSAMGATKVGFNFAELETQANLADQQKVPEKIFTEEEQAETINSVRLAYQDLSLKAQKQEEKMKHIDPAKAKQMERLGMGFNVRGNVSHSVLTDMKTIAQEPTPSAKFNTTNAKVFQKEPKMDYFDDYSTSMYSTPSSSSYKSANVDADLEMMGFETIEPIESRHSNVTSMFSSSSTSSSISPNRNMNNNNNNNNNYRNSSSGSGGGGFGSSDGRNRNNKSSIEKPSYNTYENTDAQKKFGGAKAISSDQFFGEETSSFERSANLAKFQGSNSISSAEYFGDKSSSSSRGLFTFTFTLIFFQIFPGITPLNRQHLIY